MEEERLPGTRLLWGGVGAIVLGLALGGLGAVAIWGFFSDLVSGESHLVPGAFEEELEEGEYLISV